MPGQIGRRGARPTFQGEIGEGFRLTRYAARTGQPNRRAAPGLREETSRTDGRAAGLASRDAQAAARRGGAHFSEEAVRGGVMVFLSENILATHRVRHVGAAGAGIRQLVVDEIKSRNFCGAANHEVEQAGTGR